MSLSLSSFGCCDWLGAVSLLWLVVVLFWCFGVVLLVGSCLALMAVSLWWLVPFAWIAVSLIVVLDGLLCCLVGFWLVVVSLWLLFHLLWSTYCGLSLFAVLSLVLFGWLLHLLLVVPVLLLVVTLWPSVAKSVSVLWVGCCFILVAVSVVAGCGCCFPLVAVLSLVFWLVVASLWSLSLGDGLVAVGLVWAASYSLFDVAFRFFRSLFGFWPIALIQSYLHTLTKKMSYSKNWAIVNRYVQGSYIPSEDQW